MFQSTCAPAYCTRTSRLYKSVPVSLIFANIVLDFDHYCTVVLIDLPVGLLAVRSDNHVFHHKHCAYVKNI